MSCSGRIHSSSHVCQVVILQSEPKCIYSQLPHRQVLSAQMVTFSRSPSSTEPCKHCNLSILTAMSHNPLLSGSLKGNLWNAFFQSLFFFHNPPNKHRHKPYSMSGTKAGAMTWTAGHQPQNTWNRSIVSKILMSKNTDCKKNAPAIKSAKKKTFFQCFLYFSS